MTKVLFVLLFFFALAAFKTFPLLSHLATHIPSYFPLDPLLNTWIMAWDVHALTRDPLNLFEANIFYPARHALAFSENLLGVVPIFAPIYLLTGNPVLGYNIVFFLSFVLSGCAMFCLAYYWTRAMGPSLVAGTLFAFAPIRFALISRLQLLNFFWAPMALVFLDRFLRFQRWRDLTIFAGLYWLQVLSSVYLGYIITIAVGLYVGYFSLWVDRSLLRRTMLPKALTFIGASLLVLLPIYLPYLKVSQEWGVSRALDEFVYSEGYIYLSAEPLNYLSASSFMADFYRRLLSFADPFAGTPEKWLFPGLVLPALVLVGSFSSPRSLARERLRTLRPILWIMLISGFLLSLGPFLILFGEKSAVPLPYLLLFHIIPGFRAVRAPVRFALLMILAAAPLAAMGAARLSEAWERRAKASSVAAFASPLVPVLVIVLALLELGLKPLPIERVPTGRQIPEVYRWLAAERPGPIVEFPFGLYQDNAYVYFSTSHWLPLVNGFSGFYPFIYPEIHGFLQDLPPRIAVEYLKAMGVRAVVLHTDRLRPNERDRWNSEAGANGLQKLKASGPDIVYRVPAGRPTSRLHLRLSAPDWLPPGQRVRLALSLRPDSGTSWMHPKVHEASPLTLSPTLIQWRATGDATVESGARLRLPLVILSDDPIVMPVALETPRTPGRYTLRLSIPSLGVETEPRAVDIRDGAYPTSLDSPRLLSAVYSFPHEQSRLFVRGPAPVPLTLTVRNTGQAVWLAEAAENRGVVRMRWRWLKDGREVPGMEGRLPIPYDVFPGESHEFKASIDPPRRSGLYTIQLGLVSEGVARFSDLGVSPVHLEANVEHISPCASFDDALAKWTGPPANSPRFRLFTDRPRYPVDGRVHFFVKLDRIENPLTADLYLALRGPDCIIHFFDY